MTRSILKNQLTAYTAGGLYPLHMPGHKRRLEPEQALPYDWDMTEVEGVDDLHEAEGILKEAMERTACLHGAERTWYLVGGSTCGLLAGVRALAPAGSSVLVARNCHKSVYHAIELGNLEAHWLVPPVDPQFGVYGSVRPEDVERGLAACPTAACVVLTSPTYEGVISDIGSIAAICHRSGVPLLVDEAHGAHLGLFPGWPQSAVQLGADLVVQSAHKTLPSLTQTALLHLGKGSLADPDEVERQLDVFETSSPSYPLMASLDACTGLLHEQGAALFENWRQMLVDFDRRIVGLTRLRVLCHGGDSIKDHPDFFDFDPGKLAVSTDGTAFSGTALASRLRKEDGFETEMSCGQICLAMTSIGDDAAALENFAKALLRLDGCAGEGERRANLLLPPPGETVCTIAQALQSPAEETARAEAAGRISAEYIWAYPPGVPLTAPGEKITEQFLTAVQSLTAGGTRLLHSHCKKPGCMQVLA